MTAYMRKRKNRMPKSVQRSMLACQSALFFVYQLAKGGQISNLTEEQKTTLEVILIHEGYSTQQKEIEDRQAQAKLEEAYKI
jgi:hypothetical protein